MLRLRTGLLVTAMESHSCGGDRSKTRSVPRPQNIVQRPAPDLANYKGLLSSACKNLYTIVALVAD